MHSHEIEEAVKHVMSTEEQDKYRNGFHNEEAIFLARILVELKELNRNVRLLRTERQQRLD